MADANLPTYIFGEKDDGSVELGETYHVALALALSDSRVFVRDFQSGEDFLNLLGLEDRIVFETPIKAVKAHLSDTWKIFTKNTTETSKRSNEIWGKIKDKAEEANWSASLNALTPYIGQIPGPKTLIWIRKSDYKPERNLTERGLSQLIACSLPKTTPLIVGLIPPDWQLKQSGIVQLGEFWSHPFFQTHSIAKQLWFLDWLYAEHEVKISIGMMSGALDGLALLAKRKTIFFAKFCDAKDRMAKIAIKLKDAKETERPHLNTVPDFFWLPLSGDSPGPFEEFSPSERSLLEDQLF